MRIAATGRAQTPPELAARAIAVATGEVVLLTEDHCEPGPDWVHRLVESLVPDRGAVGGSVEARPGVSTSDWAFYFADFSRFTPLNAFSPTRS